jgi:hypothetical protein
VRLYLRLDPIVGEATLVGKSARGLDLSFAANSLLAINSLQGLNFPAASRRHQQTNFGLGKDG